MKNGRMQAKDISADEFCAAIDTVIDMQQVVYPEFSDVMKTASLDHVAAALDAPVRVVQAKAAKLIKQEIIFGCACGCSGFFEVAR